MCVCVYGSDIFFSRRFIVKVLSYIKLQVDDRMK